MYDFKKLRNCKKCNSPSGIRNNGFYALTVFTKKTPHKITLDFIVYYEMKYVTI